MRIEKTKSAVRNITFGVFNKLLSVIFPFIIKTVIIYKLGVEYLGLNSLFAAILNVLNFAEIGFGTAITFSMYKPVAEDDTDTICALLNLYKKIYRIVGLIVVGCGLAVMPFLSFLIKGDVPADINLYTLYLVYLFNNVAGYFFFAYKSSLFSVHQKNDILSIISSAVNCLCYGIQIAVLYIFPNYYAYIIFTPIATVVNNLFIGYISKKKFPNYVCKGNVSPEKTAEIKKKVFGLMCHKVGSTVQSSIDNIAISAFLGLTILGVYNNYLYISSAIQSFITIFTSSVTAGIGNNIYKASKEDNYKLFIKLNFVCAFIVTFCTSCLLSLYQPFMAIWDKTNSPLNFSVVILICLLFFVNNIRCACGTYREALGTWDEDKSRPLVITIVNLVGTIISAVLGSLEGIIISTIVAYAVVSIYWETDVLYKAYFNRSKSEYFLKTLLYTLVAIVTSVSTFFICELLPGGGIKLFALRTLVCVAVTVLIQVLLLCWTKEFRYCLNKVGKLFRRKTQMMKKIKKFFRKYGLHRIYTENVYGNNRDWKCYKKLQKKYAKNLTKKYSLNDSCKRSNKVWVCWLQGIENAPALVKVCFESLKKHMPEKEIVLITSENINDYVTFPDFIVDKWKRGIISNTHLSDILRLELLIKYGGIWIDSTVLCTGKIPEYVERSPLFVFRNDYRNYDTMRLSNWLISSVSNHPILLQTRDFIYDYWKNENKLVNYFFFHFFMTMAMNLYSDLTDQMTFCTNINPHTLQFVYLFKKFDEKTYEYLKHLSFVHKLSYKFNLKRDLTGTFYDELINKKNY